MLKKITAERVLYFIAVGLLAYMPFHIFLSRWLSLYTGGLGQWDAAKDVVTLIGLVIAIFIAIRNKLFQHKFVLIVFLLAALYGLIHVAFFMFNREDQDFRSFIVATLFNGRIMAYLFMGMVIGLTQKVSWHKVARIVLIASTITCLIAIVQYVAPKDLMTHFGYSIERGVKPAFFIDDKPDFPRIMSTTRDPNSYGAYLILPILILAGMITQTRHNRSQATKLILVLLLHLIALFLTFSRGAWLGLAIAVLVALYLHHGKRLKVSSKNYKKTMIVFGICILVITLGTYATKEHYVFKNIILHSDESTVLADPNELRIRLQNQAIRYISADPEGHGPGTAGLVSIGNPKGTFLTENYYLQIAYEAGVIGLTLFITLMGIAGFCLYRINNMMGLALASSFAAYVFIGFLIHLWSNEAVALQWWLLAGIMIGYSNEYGGRNGNTSRKSG